MNVLWKKIVNTISDGLVFIGPDGRIRLVNKAFENLTGYTADEAAGMPCSALECGACEKTLQQTGADPVSCRLFTSEGKDMDKCRCLLKRKDGSLFPVLKNASVFKDKDNNVIGIVETLTDISELERLDEKVNVLSRHFKHENHFFGMVGKSRQMETVFDMIRKAANANAPVMISGESGSGKELVANAVHFSGARKKGPFIRLNCATVNAPVLESEMFGHAKGAFTGAHDGRIGRFEAADNGSLLLDEVGDLPEALQTMLLRVLESGQFERVGETMPVRADVRIITATNKNMEELVEQDRFRQDLFYRINTIPIHVPALRERKEDIPLLVNAFIQNLNRTSEKKLSGVDRKAMDRLIEYPWPGNVRELRNALEYAFITADGPVVRFAHLPKAVLSQNAAFTGSLRRPEQPDTMLNEIPMTPLTGNILRM